jgi:hypothetical protein
MVEEFDLLERDHKTIHKALVTSGKSSREFVESIGQGSDTSRSAGDAYSTDSDLLLALLHRHIADEEDLIVPAMLHFGERSVS